MVIYNREIEGIIDELNTSRDEGLTRAQVEQKLEKYGPNELEEGEGISARAILIEQFKNIIVILLLVAAGIAFLMGDYLEGFAVLAVIILNALFGFFTEYRAEKSVEALKKMVTTRAKIRREGRLKKIDAPSIVPGDILILEEGDRITADGRLIEADNLYVDEAVLTGESEPVNKNTGVLSGEVPLAERTNMVFMGTAVTRGNGIVVVTGTGNNTEMGKISSLLHETEEGETPLEKRLDRMGKSLIKLTLIIAAVVTIFGIIVGLPVVHMLKTGIALAIAAVPEGLPAVATITLAIGMKKMAGYNALVKRLPAVETLGSTTVICTDKTGTLTEDQMTLKKILFSDWSVQITGTGYKPEGEFEIDGEKVEPGEERLQLFLRAGLLCSNAAIEDKGSTWNVIGDPTEGALVAAAMKAGYSRESLQDRGYRRLFELPFTSVKKYMAVSYQIPGNDFEVYVKGAPAVVLDMCNQVLETDGQNELTAEKKQTLRSLNKKMAGEGLRVLAVAYRNCGKAETETDIENVIDNGLTFIGFAGIMDPPRPDVKEAITEAGIAGVRTIMITGDQEDTAVAIAGEVGIEETEGRAITGTDLEELDLAELTQKIKNHNIFARVSPENKLDIVDALNENNEVTAMTGDGVNDAPALKKADIGVAMGQRGTAVSREAADMILLDDRFSTIVRAIKYGRVIFDNIEKFIYYLFSCNLSEIMFIFIGIILQLPVPLLTLQILWLNLVTDVFPALVLAWEPPEEEVMARKPRDPEESILNPEFKKAIGLHALIIVLGPLAAYIYALNTGYSVEMARTVGFMTLALVQLFHVFDARRKNSTGLDRSVFDNLYLWGAIVLTLLLQFVAVYAPPLQVILDTVPIKINEWMIILIASILPVIVVQIIKFNQ